MADPNQVPSGVTFGDPGQTASSTQATNTPNSAQSQPNSPNTPPPGVTFGEPQTNTDQDNPNSVDHHGLLARAWDWMNKPIADNVMPKDMKTADIIKALAYEKLLGKPYIPGVNDFDTFEEQHLGESPTKHALKTFIAGSAKDTANMAAGFTSPVQTALMAIGAGEAGMLGKTVGAISKPVGAVAGTAFAGLGAHQTYQAVRDAVTNGLSPENVQQGLTGASMTAGGAAGAGRGVSDTIQKIANSKLRPTTETVGNTEVPVRNPSFLGETAQKTVPDIMSQFAKERTGPAVAKGIGEVAKEAAGTEGVVSPDQHDRLGIRGVADEVKGRSQEVFKKLDEVSGNMLSEAQQMADDASGDYSSAGRKEYRQAMDMQDAIFENYKNHSEMKGMDLDQAKEDWRKQVALRDISKKLTGATESSETGNQDYQLKQGKQLAESVDSLVKNDKDVLQRAGFSDDHIDQLQNFGRIVREQAETPKFSNYMSGIAKTLSGAIGFHEGGWAGAMGGTAMEMAGEHVGGVLANRMLGKVLTTPEALPILSNGLKNNVNPAIVTNQLKSVIAKTDPTWAAKMGETLSNLWHDESGQLNIPGTNTQTVGTAEGAKADTAFFQRAKEELGADASFSDVAKRAQEMKSQSQGPTMNYEHDQTGKFGNLHHMVTTTQNGAKIGELAAQDTGPGVATIRSNQIYDEANRGKGYGKAQLMHLLTNAIDSDVKTVNSDISTTGAAQNVWNSLEKRFPDAVTKKEYADGRPQWSVNLKALKERMDFEGTGNYTGEERRGTERKTMNATELEDAIKNRKPINTPFNDTEGARETINRDQNMPKHPAELATSEK